jgi:F-type H+-transporting ATPase subunit c
MRKLQYACSWLWPRCSWRRRRSPKLPGGGSAAPSWVPIGAGIGMAIASGLCGLGQGRATASATEALARNPGARAGILTMLLLGLAFMESLALFTLLIIFAEGQQVAFRAETETPCCVDRGREFLFAERPYCWRVLR